MITQWDHAAPTYGQLSAEEREAHAEIQGSVNHTLEQPVSAKCDAFVASHAHTADALAEMAVWLRANEDESGARMLERFAREMARHEATIV